MEKGLDRLEEARKIFENGNTFDYQQGLGWFWILQADLANTGIIVRQSSEILQFTGKALEILTQLKNWPGVARAYAARAMVYEKLGDKKCAEKDRAKQKLFENMPDIQAGAR
jgi:hypothetical protein